MLSEGREQYNPCYTIGMKTAISLSDELFQAAELEAQRLKVSRSELYSRALAGFLKRRKGDEITQKLNEVYGQNASALDPAVHEAQRILFNTESW